MEKITTREHKDRIDAVIDHILKNIGGDISLESLAGVANYSPFHLQKVFKDLVGESPKQYIIRSRLECAVHLLVIQQHKLISEIGMDCGFSSPSAFSRAFKSYFGISPETVRDLKHKEKRRLMKKVSLKPVNITTKSSGSEKTEIKIKKTNPLHGIYIRAPFNDPAKIHMAYKQLSVFASSNGLNPSIENFRGIMSPKHGHTYMAFLVTPDISDLPGKYNQTSIKSGRYATITTKGNSQATMKSVHYLFQEWLPESGYRIADEVLVHETFSEHPAQKAYEKLEREIHVPIVPC